MNNINLLNKKVLSGLIEVDKGKEGNLRNKERNMSRSRITSREAEASEILRAVESLERFSAVVDDSGLASEANSAAKEDMKTVNESRPAGAADLKDQGDQNAKANKNWPVSEADKVKVARKLVTLAKELLQD